MDFMDAIEGIGATGGADTQYAIGLGISGSIADAGSYTFNVTSQVDLKPERLELGMVETAYGGVTVDVFTIAGENQLGSSDAIGATCYHPQMPNTDVDYDIWTAGSMLSIKVTNKTGAAIQVTGTIFGELR